jgi:hypothetical protein
VKSRRSFRRSCTLMTDLLTYECRRTTDGLYPFTSCHRKKQITVHTTVAPFLSFTQQAAEAMRKTARLVGLLLTCGHTVQAWTSSSRCSAFRAPTTLVAAKNAEKDSSLSVAQIARQSPNDADSEFRSQEVVIDERLSVSYKILAGLDPQWFQRFVLAPLGASEIIDGEPISEIVAQGKNYSRQWMAKKRVVEESKYQRIDSNSTSGPQSKSTIPVDENRSALDDFQFASTNRVSSVSGMEEEPPVAAVDSAQRTVPEDERVTRSNELPGRKEIEEISVWKVTDDQARPEQDILATQSDCVDEASQQDAIFQQATMNIDISRPNESKDSKVDENLRDESPVTPPSSTTTITTTLAAKEDPLRETRQYGKDGNVPEETPTKEQSTNNSQHKEDAETANDRVVIYKGPSAKSWKQLPLEQLVSLGYTEEDVKALIPDTLDLIASERIKCPRNGLPARWKQKGSRQELVRVVSAREAKLLATSNKKKAPLHQHGGRNPPRAKKPELTEPMQQRHKTLDSTTRPKYARDDLTARIDRRRRRERVTVLEDGSPKPVYNGRKTLDAVPRRRHRGDPPSPNSIIWPDMDSFRKLLRKEAELRLGILGDGWADAVKDETMWRHDLYSDWLWILKNGVGNPIVESRSSRDRRKRENKSRPHT